MPPSMTPRLAAVHHAAMLLLHGCAARMRPAERSALMDLYDTTGGPSWADRTYWTRDGTVSEPCRAHAARIPYRIPDGASTAFVPNGYFPSTPWCGVGCTDPCDDYLDGEACTAGRVTGLHMPSNGLVGTIENWNGVGELANVTHLDLSYNSLGGALPTELGRINNVEIISFRNNALTGLLPPELAMVNANGVGRLRELSISHNSLSGTLPSELGLHAMSLQLLEAKDNRLSGTLPPELGQLQRLQAMMLLNNSLSGTLPEDFGAPAAGAEALALANRFEGEGDPQGGGGGLQELRYLELQHNAGISGTLPSSLRHVGRSLHTGVPELAHSLHVLHIYGSRVSGTLPTELGALTELTSLRLDANDFSGTIPTEIGNLRKLEVLDLYNNPLQGDMPSELARLVNIRLFYLPNEVLTPLRMHYCGQRMPSLGKYSYRIVREEYMRFSQAICPEPLDVLGAFGTLAQLSGDI